VGKSLAETIGFNGAPEDIWESADALSPDDYENFEEAVVDQATAAQTIQELEAEIIILESWKSRPAGRSLGPGPQVGRAVQAAAEHARDA
jgi:hypothetical protein